ncbi:OmpA family protein [Bacteriovoracaceae bacterium]|nr:OmpA family protein [Bacteriovoracaceae bacterium]
MFSKKVLFIYSLLLVFCSVNSWSNSTHNFSPLTLGVGIDTGLSFTKSSDIPGEQNKEGKIVDIKGILTYKPNPFIVLDGAAGLFATKISGPKGAKGKAQGLSLQFSALANLSDLMLIGPTVKSFTGEGVQFNDDVSEKYATSKRRNALFAGGIIAKEFKYKGYDGRVGIQITRDWTVGNRDVYTSQVVLQVGFPTGKQSTYMLTKVGNSKKQKNIRSIASDKEKSPPLKKLTVTLNKLNDVYFSTNSTELLPYAKTQLDAIAALLMKKSRQWKQIKLIGQTNAEVQNRHLSKARSRTVATYLKRKGVPLNKMKLLIGKATNTEKNNDKNRRVKILFKGLRHPASFSKDLEETRQNLFENQINKKDNKRK